MKKYALQVNISYSIRPQWKTLEGGYDTLEEAKAALDHMVVKSRYRIAEAYTVVRYKPVKDRQKIESVGR